MSRPMTIDQQVLHVYVALQNLAHGRPVNEIAADIGRSRFATARMVKRARALGLIEVRATVSAPVDVGISTELAQRYGLRTALVVATHATDAAASRDAIARIAARFIVDIVGEDDILGFAPGRTLVLASRLIDALPRADVVQLSGVGAPRLEDGVEVISNVGRLSGGATHPLYLPAVLMKDPEARVILRHPSIQRTLRKLDHVDKAFLTIGGWPEASLMASQLSDLGERQEYEDKGVVAEMGTMLLDAHGNMVSGLEDRFVGISQAQLRRVPMRIAIGGGPGKERAVLAALRSGIPDHLITDIRCAKAALAA
ncbi:sugar-binding transcriptional regulator [Ruania albidiflava]|uniref:sugar-binding transcriptional regulator n=1 Tax=Ruania albidiflava TaxID=366586 RepID=UPI0023F5436B|nr:sugar-binding domain-containing protein [Ruania albidiflava]